MRPSLNNVWFGLLAGLILPLAAFLVFYLFMADGQHPGAFLHEIISRNVLTQVLSLCAIPNLLLFFVFIWTDHLYGARGVLTATFVLAIIILLYKWLS